MKYVFFFLITMLAVPSFAQGENDLELADYYYSQGQYEQAKLYYEKIYKTNRTNKVYTNYLNTLIALNDFEEAEKMVKKKMRTENEDGTVYVQLGNLYNKFGKPADAKAQFDLAVEKLVPTRNNVSRLANEFNLINEFDYMLQVYMKGKNQGNDGYTYAFEIANLQGSMGNLDEMTESFLDLLYENEGYLQTVQNSFNRTLNFQENPESMDMLKTKLLKKAQLYPEKTIYTEMLAWLFMQKKDFASAYVQLASLDKRNNETGDRLFNLAELARNNKEYETARKCYQYVVDKGPASPFYITARSEKIFVTYDELQDKPGIDKTAYALLEQECIATLNELGKNVDTAMLMQKLAHIQTFYLDKASEAVPLLQQAIDLPGLYAAVKATIKLELGDVYVFLGNVWDASLLFSQVELDFKEDPLGHSAKFRNARISYYTGDFNWAQAQLDVLKASTSKLISNDAIDLSLLITDNFNMDTLTTAMEMFARADLLSYQNKYDASMVTLDSIVTEFPMHSLTDEILMLKGNMYYRQGKFTEAREQFQKVVDLHFMDITADDALFKLAEMSQFLDNDTAKAMELYEKLITDFPGSLFVVEARKRFRELRGDAIN